MAPPQMGMPRMGMPAARLITTWWAVMIMTDENCLDQGP